MTGGVFVDTNVLVHVRDSRDVSKQRRAVAWHEYLWKERQGRISMQVIAEFYVTLTRLSGNAVPAGELWDRAARYFAWNPQQVDEALLRRARAVIGTVTVRSPFTLAVAEPRSAYELPVAAPLHRPRGRPRRAEAIAAG